MLLFGESFEEEMIICFHTNRPPGQRDRIVLPPLSPETEECQIIVKKILKNTMIS